MKSDFFFEKGAQLKAAFDKAGIPCRGLY